MTVVRDTGFNGAARFAAFARVALALTAAAPAASQSATEAPTELPAGASYVGSKTCVGCHPAQSSALDTAMGDALRTARGSEFLKSRPRLEFERGPYRYSITRDEEGSLYSVTDGEATVTTRILWSFGHGKAGQTYVFELDGELYESRVSYYLAIDGLDLTLGAPLDEIPGTIEQAAGRRMTDEDVRGCFGCHATGATRAGEVALESMIPGIQCEGCHGSGARHAAAVQAQRPEDLAIRSLKNQPAEVESDFCGSCHRTWADVMLMGLQGPGNVRFQPYRIANSRCYDADDPRIRCSACHDPHQDPDHRAASYDAACLNCHSTAAACPVGERECSNCHMPKVEIPGSHFRFTDHQIRIDRPDQPYPN